MSQRIPEETIQEVLLRTDIVDVIGDYVLLKQSGANYKGLCPFHTEKTPSFTVSPVKGLFYCFGCRASGDVVRFLMQHEALPFPDAIRWLAARYGVHLAATTSAPCQDTLSPLYTLHQAATTFFHTYLCRDPAAQAGRDYCRQRRINSELAKHFELGYAPEAWEMLARALQRQGFAPDLLVQSGLAVARQGQDSIYDRFRHRLMFPIHDRLGRPVAFGGRALATSETVHVPKYLNSPETPIFHKSRILYGFHLAKQSIRQQKRAIVVEGYTDVLACHRQGVTHVVGTLGTALTAHHVALLKGCTQEVVLMFDSDTAGGAAAERSIGLFLDADMRVRVAELPAAQDPDSFLQQHTGAAFLQYVEASIPFVDYLLSRAKRFTDVSTPAGQADCVKRLLPLLRKIDNHVERWGYMATLAEQIGIPPEVLGREMTARPTDRKPTPQPPSEVIPGRRVQARPPSEEYALVHLLYHDSGCRVAVQDQVSVAQFQDATLGALYALFLRLMPQCTEATWLQTLHDAASPTQASLLAKMAMEPLLSEAAARPQELRQYLAKMRQRSLKAQLQHLRAQLQQAHEATDQQRLLQECDRLGKELGEYAQNEAH